MHRLELRRISSLHNHQIIIEHISFGLQYLKLRLSPYSLFDVALNIRRVLFEVFVKRLSYLLFFYLCGSLAQLKQIYVSRKCGISVRIYRIVY